MNKLQRFSNVFIGLLMLIVSGILLLVGKDGYIVIIAILSLTLLIAAIKTLVFYFKMARYMVGGKRMLYNGVIMLDLAIFTMSLNRVPVMYVILYLIIIHAFAGGIAAAKAIQDMRQGARSWKLKLSSGVVQLLMAAVCFINIHSMAIVVYVYAAGLAYSAIVRIISSFRKTDVVYIN